MDNISVGLSDCRKARALSIDVDRRILELEREFGQENLSTAFIEYFSEHYSGREAQVATLFEDFLRLWATDDDAALRVAASIASLHHSFKNEASAIRSWLTLLALQSDLALQIGGKPRKVLDEFGQKALRQAKLRGEAMGAIWDQPMFGPREVASAIGAKPSNREKVRQFRVRSWIVGLPSGRGFLYPAFQFDVNRREVFPEVRAVNVELSANSDPWGAASWWIAENARLQAIPADLVGTSRAQDLAYAAGAITELIG